METLRRWDKSTEIEVQATLIRFPKSTHTKLKEMAAKENRSMTLIITEAVNEMLKTHGDGNPNFTLDQFDEKDFKACPALFRNREAWENYYKNLTQIEYKELDQQLNLLLAIHNENIK